MEEEKWNAAAEDYNYMPLRDVVFYTLRKEILQGVLKPGERLMEVKLANRLGVSRTPIREAIRMLELEGLVVMVPRKGAQVASITEKELLDVLEVRSGLEEMAVKLACRRITEEQLEELKQDSRNFEKAVRENNLRLLAEADVAFHDLICRATGNRRLMQMLNNIREQIYRYRVEYLKDENVRQALVEEHDELCRCLAAGDVEGAVSAMRSHIAKQQSHILNRIPEGD